MHNALDSLLFYSLGEVPLGGASLRFIKLLCSVVQEVYEAVSATPTRSLRFPLQPWTFALQMPCRWGDDRSQGLHQARSSRGFGPGRGVLNEDGQSPRHSQLSQCTSLPKMATVQRGYCSFAQFVEGCGRRAVGAIRTCIMLILVVCLLHGSVLLLIKESWGLKGGKCSEQHQDSVLETIPSSASFTAFKDQVTISIWNSNSAFSVHLGCEAWCYYSWLID